MKRLFYTLFVIFGLVGCELERDEHHREQTDGGLNGESFTCSGEYLSRFPEACDGYDDDCDGTIDEGIQSCAVPRADLPFKHCNTPCCFGDSACDSGQVCHPLEGQGRCGDPCQDGELRLCSFGCEPKFQACVGRVWAPCDSAKPQMEECNERDDDCDGVVDEARECAFEDMGVDVGVSLDAALDLGISDLGIAIDSEIPDAVEPVDKGPRTGMYSPFRVSAFSTVSE